MAGKYDNRAELLKMIEACDLSHCEEDYEVQSEMKWATDLFQSAGYKVQSGASKLCLVNENGLYVCKWVYGNQYNEAVEEAKVYQRAVEAGLERFFPVTSLACEKWGITFVFQQKIDSSVSALSYEMNKKYRHQCRTAIDAPSRIWEKMEKEFGKAGNGYRRPLDTTWASMALTLYGKKVCKKLCAFIVENGINDLHDSNIGYYKGKPIILDFSGYNR